MPPHLLPSLLLFSSATASVLKGALLQQRASPAAFWSWCRNHLVAHNKLAIHRFDDGLRGLIATEDVAADECVLEIPLSMCFVRESSPDDDKWPCELALDMIAEMDKGAESKWYPYLSALPTAAELRAVLPVHWGAEALEAAFSSNEFIFDDDVKLACENSWAWRDHVWAEVAYRARRLGDSKEDRRHAVQSRLAPKAAVEEGLLGPTYRVQNRRLVPLEEDEERAGDKGEKTRGGDREQQICTRAQFEYALDLVQTRNCCPDRVGGPDGPAKPSLHLIVPLLDFLNHDASADTSMLVDDDKQTVRLLTRRPIARGQQIFLNYHLEEQIYSPLKSGAGGPGGAPLFQMDVAAYALTSYGFLPRPLEEVNILLPLDVIRGVLVDAATSNLLAGAGGGGEGVREGSALSILQALGIQISQPFIVYRDGISTSLLGCCRVLALGAEEREALWKGGAEAQRLAVLGQGRIGAAVRAQLAALLSEERAKHEAVVAGAGEGKEKEEAKDEEDEEEAEGKEEDEGRGAPQRVRLQYSHQAAEVLSCCERWLAALQD